MKYFILVCAMLLLNVKINSKLYSAVNQSQNKYKKANLLTENEFNALFPLRNKFYTYSAFIKAVNEMAGIKIKITKRAVSVYQFIRTVKRTGKSTLVRQDEDWDEAWAKTKSDSTYVIDYGNFCSEKTLQINKRELAAFFAHIAHETRHGENEKYNDGLMFVHEINTNLPYVTPNNIYPAVNGKKYYGRGPMQLSYNGNYGYASDCIFGNKNILLENPDLIETDAVTAFKTAIYFWMTPQAYKPSAHDVMIGKWQPSKTDISAQRVPGFGMTINIVNGQVECGKGEKVYNMNDRIGFYNYFMKRLGASDPACACSCGNMKPF